jgi:hypothetical protein
MALFTMLNQFDNTDFRYYEIDMLLKILCVKASNRVRVSYND